MFAKTKSRVMGTYPLDHTKLAEIVLELEKTKKVKVFLHEGDISIRAFFGRTKTYGGVIDDLGRLVEGRRIDMQNDGLYLQTYDAPKGTTHSTDLVDVLRKYII